ncbi:MAG: hypothetical protein ACE5R6_20410 [Candidatus Heimdallarchaeota archaeon]
MKLILHKFLKLFIVVIVLFSCQPIKKWQTVENQKELHSWAPRTLYRDFYTWPELSPDGSQIAYIREGQLKVLDFPFDQEKDISSSFGFDRVKGFSWQGNGAQIEIIGTKKRQSHKEYFIFKQDVEINVPVSSKGVVWSKDGKNIAYYLERDQQKGIWIAEEDNSNAILAIPNIYPRYMTFSNNGYLLAVISEDKGLSNKLTIYYLHEKKYAVLIDSLDAIEPVYFTPDDESLLISMVSDKPFEAKNIHKAVADRDLDIFSLNIKNKSMTKIIGGEGEDVIIGIKDNRIYWATIKASLGIGLVSLYDGHIKQIINENAFLPCWHPKGNKISTSYGQFRLMDFPMNWDIASVEIDSLRQVVKELYPEVAVIMRICFKCGHLMEKY